MRLITLSSSVTRQMRARFTLVRSLIFTFALLWPNASIPQTAPVDIALVLAIDCSFSVDSTEYRLQMEGLGAAIQDPAVLDAIKRGPYQRIAITAFQWSDNNNQYVVMPWTILDSEASVTAAGMILADGARNLAEGGTSISHALLFANALFASAPPTSRRTIDLSTDGRNNIGPLVTTVRDQVVANRITINVLAIANEYPTLDVYAESQIVGGPGNFVIKAKTYDDFGAAMLRKLIKEIVGPGLA